ncbi:MAG: 2Fe-2S iron-sulfur cluster-binding protein [Beijerinckiaceae bacterium]|jgi:2Fe-2S ferredoxin
MIKVTYIDSAGEKRVVAAEEGSTLMEAAIRNSVPEIVAECGGACACATCHVYVDAAFLPLTGKADPKEEDMLDFAYAVQPNSRLSCQIKLTPALDGLIVRTPPRQG